MLISKDCRNAEGPTSQAKRLPNLLVFCKATVDRHGHKNGSDHISQQNRTNLKTSPVTSNAH